MYVLWRVIVKEFLQLKQDKRMIPMVFMAPVVQLLLFGYAANLDVATVPLTWIAPRQVESLSTASSHRAISSLPARRTRRKISSPGWSTAGPIWRL